MFNYYDLTRSELVIGGVTAATLAAQFGTPLYIYDAGVVQCKLRLLQEHLPNFQILYSLKANANLALAKLLRSWGIGCEIASAGELVLAQTAGFKPEQIFFAGPGKTETELELALAAGIHCFNVESKTELLRLEALGKRLDRKVPVALRINTQETAAGAGEQMVGGASKFGWDEERVTAELSALIPQFTHVQLVGIHVYTGSQILNVAELVANAERTLRVARRLSQELGFKLKVLDFGGGFGVPYSPEQQELDLTLLGRELKKLLAAAQPWLSPEKTTLFFELGRYLVAECGFYLTRVIDVKASRGEHFVITDGGMNQWLRPVFMHAVHPTFVANKLNQQATTRYQVGGPCCTPIDIIAPDVLLPQVEIGDLIAIGNAGAYGFSMSMLYFLGHPLPAEVLVWQGQPQLVRRRGKPGDCLVNQIL